MSLEFCSPGQPLAVAPSLTALHPKLFRYGEIGVGGGEGAIASGWDMLDRELPGGGWPRGGLVELCGDLVGIGELSLALGPAPRGDSTPRATADPRGMVWILPPGPKNSLPWVPYAPGLIEVGALLDRLIVVRASRQDEALWCAEQAARSGAVARVLIWLGEFAGNPLPLRRLQQAAATGGTTIFAYRPGAVLAYPSPAILRLALTAGADGLLEVVLAKRRGLPDGKTVRIAPRSLSCLQRPRTAAWQPPPIPRSLLSHLAASRFAPQAGVQPATR